ncbi:MAG TPA: hypothetical protein VN780_12980 [Candidatus Eisenbacteria bacterium]|nr:hypothetical protein [Candidatus Eisenbacteria bacterium]
MTDLPVTLMRFLALLAASCAIPCSFGVAGRPEPPPLGLKPATVEAFNQYVHLTDSRSEADLRQGADLLWIDSLDAQARNDAYAALKRGEVKIKKLETLENGSPIHCPNGLVHHWIAVVFIPRAKLSDVLAVLQDYDHHSDYYAPDVERSKLEQHDANHFRAFLRFRRHKVVTVVLDTEHDVRYFLDTVGRAHSRSSATRIAQVANAGKPDEREKMPGDDDGFLWRMETWWRMVERDGGVYVQSEVVSLTRDIPTGLGWLIGPFVNSIPKESLTFTMEATRRAVASHLTAPAR